MKVRHFLVMMRSSAECVFDCNRKSCGVSVDVDAVAACSHRNAECAAVHVGDVNYEDESLVQLTGGGRREMSSASQSHDVEGGACRARQNE